MSERPFHHGSLRAALLDQAELVLRARGVDELSLRELARDLGVSHGAPRSHFIDRKTLLDALAERGFLRLANNLREAAAQHGDDFAAALRASAHAYVAFAITNSGLLELMFAAKVDSPSESLLTAAGRLFDTIRDIMAEGVDAGALDQQDVERLTLVISASMLGISTFVASHRVTAAQGDVLMNDAVAMFLSGSLDRETAALDTE